MGIQASFWNAVVDTEKHAKFMVIDGKTALQSQSPQKLFIRKDTKKYMHAKLILTEEMAFVGSQNLTPGGLAWNREVGILVSDTTALVQLKKAFETDWDEAPDGTVLN